MTRHEGDPASRVPAIKREHQVPGFIAGAPLHNEEMDKGTSKTISRAPTVLEDGSFYVCFKDGDIRNPVNFSPTRKWAITIIACVFTSIVAAAVSSYTMGYSSMIRDLNCTLFQATLGFSVYTIGFALVPLVTSSSARNSAAFLFTSSRLLCLY